MTQKNRRRHNKLAGCGKSIFKLVLLILIFISLVFLLKKSYLLSDIKQKIRMTQYPIKYEYFVEKYSAEYDVDKYLVYSVIKEESKFDKYAVSKANAKGLMQLTEKTAIECSDKIGINYSETILFDPETNIQFGTFYLSYLIDKYKSIDNAIASYNAGLGNVNKWLSDKSNIDENGNLIKIPFDETRNYVENVKKSYEMYKSIYDGDI